MHIPDGLLHPVAWIGAGAVSAGAMSFAMRQARHGLADRTVPLMGVTAACVFAAQMLNFPIPGGTSGHFMGGVLAAVLLGPWAGMLVMAIVLAVQCVLFQDGGLSALGANVLNMAVVGCGAGYALYDVIRRRIGGLRGTIAGAVLASWFSVMAAATLCSLEISIAGPYRLGPTLGAMLLVHSAIGIGEALITGLALSLILRARPDLIHGQALTPGFAVRTAQVLVVGLVLALVMAAILSPFASQKPDGLDATLENVLRFNAEEAKPAISSPFPEYKIPGLEKLGIAGSVAGALGTVVVFGVALALAWAWPRRSSSQHMKVPT